MIEDDKPAEDFSNTNDGVENQAGKEPVPQSDTKAPAPDSVHPVDQGIKPHRHHPVHGNRDQPNLVTDKDRPAGQQNPAPVPGSPGYKGTEQPGPQDPNAPKPDAAS